MFDLGIIQPHTHTEEEKKHIASVTFGFSGTQVIFQVR